MTKTEKPPKKLTRLPERTRGLEEGLAELANSERKPPKRLRRLHNVTPVTEEGIQEQRRRADGVKKTSLGPRRVLKLKPSPSSTLTAAQLADQYRLQEQLVRLWLRNAEFKRPGTRWEWPEGHRDIPKVRRLVAGKATVHHGR